MTEKLPTAGDVKHQLNSNKQSNRLKLAFASLAENSAAHELDHNVTYPWQLFLATVCSQSAKYTYLDKEWAEGVPLRLYIVL